MFHSKKLQNFEEAIAASDAVYIHVFKMSMTNLKMNQLKLIRLNTILNTSISDLLKSNCAIMHPFPRRGELDPKIDLDPRAKYWRQERNGMWTRLL